MNLFAYAAPQRFYALAGRLIPWFAVSAALLCLVGLWLGFWEAPTDFQQGEVYRIIFIHVPAAWMAMFIYLVMAIYAILNLGFRTRMSAMMIAALAPTGALWAAIALWTGSLWGKPTWGTYWAWDARMTSTLILLFLYFGYLALTNAIEDRNRADLLEDGHGDAAGHAGDVAGGLVLQRGGGPAPGTQHHPGARGAHAVGA